MSTLTDGINEWAAAKTAARRPGTPLLYFLGLVAAIFIGILIFVFVVTKQTNPVFLDEHGNPASYQAQSGSH